MVSIKKKENHTTLLWGPLKGKENRTWSRGPHCLTYLNEAYQMPTEAPPPASKRIAETLHWKIQIVPRAVRLLEHKLREEALLSVSNILSIIHKDEEQIKRYWLVLRKGTWLCGWHSSYIWPNVGFLSAAIVRNIFPWVCILPTRHCTIWTKQMTGIIMHRYQICCQQVQITVFIYCWSNSIWIYMIKTKKKKIQIIIHFFLNIFFVNISLFLLFIILFFVHTLYIIQ